MQVTNVHAITCFWLCQHPSHVAGLRFKHPLMLVSTGCPWPLGCRLMHGLRIMDDQHYCITGATCSTDIRLHVSCLLCDHRSGACPLSQQAMLQGLAAPGSAGRASVPRASMLRAGALCVGQRSHIGQLLDSSVLCTAYHMQQVVTPKLPIRLSVLDSSTPQRRQLAECVPWLGQGLQVFRNQPSLRVITKV